METESQNITNGWTIVQTKRTRRIKKDKVKEVKKEKEGEVKDVKVIGRKKSKYGTFKNKNKYLPKNNDNKKKYSFLEKLKYKLSTANLSIDEEKSLILKIKEIEDKEDDDDESNEGNKDNESNIQNQMCNFCKNLGKTNFKGHIAKNCTILKNYQCTKCGNQGHTRKYCKNSYKPRCHYCKEFGHIIKLCPILEKNDDDSVITELPENNTITETIIVE